MSHTPMCSLYSQIIDPVLTLPSDKNEASAAASLDSRILEDRSLALVLDLGLNYSASCEGRAKGRCTYDVRNISGFF